MEYVKIRFYFESKRTEILIYLKLKPLYTQVINWQRPRNKTVKTQIVHIFIACLFIKTHI